MLVLCDKQIHHNLRVVDNQHWGCKHIQEHNRMLHRIKIWFFFINLIQNCTVQCLFRLITNFGCLCPFCHLRHIANDEPACARENCYALGSVEAKSTHSMEVLIDQ